MPTLSLNPSKQLKKNVYEKLKDSPYKEEDIKERLELELNRIIEKGYANYFLIVQDLIDWCKKKGILTG